LLHICRGTTGSDLSDGGILLRSDSTNYMQISSGSTGDSDLILFYKKSGAAIAGVGSIGTEGGDLTIGTGTNCGLQFNDANAAIRPFSMTGNAPADNVVDLGISTTRWKDFYMAGDMNVGSQTSNIVPSNRKAWFQGGGSYFTSYTAGQSTITTDASGLIVGTPSTRSGTANLYTAGISFDHLLNYSTTGNITYNTYPHAWIGLKTYDFPGYERSSLVLATRNDTSGAGPTAEQLVISPYGEITMPNQPSFSVYISGTNPTLSNGSKIPYDAEEWDTNSDFDTTNNRFVAPVAGKYQFNIIHNVYGVSTGEWFRHLIAVNGSTVQYAAYEYSDSGSDQTICTPFMASLSAGDYIEVFHSSSDNVVGLSAGTTWNKFQGFLIG